MGIWYNGKIKEEGHASSFNIVPDPVSIFSSLRLDKGGGNLGLLSFPNSGSFLYPSDGSHDINIAFDGSITNRKTLYRKLNMHEAEDIASLLVSLYRKYGAEGFWELEGAFSLIVVDRKKQCVLLHRSFLTGYPLYYTTKNGCLSVSTNPMDLLHRKDISDTLDMGQMSAFFALDAYAWSGTVFSDLREVEHGETVTISAKGVHSMKRPLKELLPTLQYGSEAETIDHYRCLVEQSVAKHLSPNTRYGIMLSSGMDSSTLAVLASRLLKKNGERLRAYSWSLPHYPEADETEKVKILCRSLDMDLTLLDVERDDPFSDLDHLALQPDIPFSNLYNRMLSRIYAEASKDGVEVLFNGNYGDELFPPSRALFTDILNDKRYELLIPTLRSLIGKVGYRNILKHPAIRGFVKHHLPFYRPAKARLHIPEWLSSEAKEHRRTAIKKRDRENEEGYEIFVSALSKFNTDAGIVRYATERFGIARIEPYRDASLLNYTLRLPAHMAFREGQMKYVAREAMRGLLPEAIRTQPRAGLLSRFALDSFMQNTEAVRERLFDDRDPWNTYVDEKWMQERLKDPEHIEEKELLIVWMCLNMAHWEKAIKPGGSLYESTFMQDSVQR